MICLEVCASQGSTRGSDKMMSQSMTNFHRPKLLDKSEMLDAKSRTRPVPAQPPARSDSVNTGKKMQDHGFDHVPSLTRWVLVCVAHGVPRVLHRCYGLADRMHSRLRRARAPSASLSAPLIATPCCASARRRWLLQHEKRTHSHSSDCANR